MLRTRLDPKSDTNNSIKLVHSSGAVYAEITLTTLSGNLEISTISELHVAKPNGWSSVDIKVNKSN